MDAGYDQTSCGEEGHSKSHHFAAYAFGECSVVLELQIHWP